MERTDTVRLFIALLISMGAIFLWNFFYVNPKLEAQEEWQKANAPKTALSEVNRESINGDSLIKNQVINKVSEDAENPQAVAEKEVRLKIKTDKMHGSINLKGAVFDDVTLADYHLTMDKTSPEVVLFSDKNSELPYYAKTGYLAANKGVKTPDEQTVWRVKNGDENSFLSIDTPITLYWEGTQGLTFEKKISIDDKYMISIEETVINNTEKALTFVPYGTIVRSDTPEDTMYISHEGPIMVNQGVLEEISYDDIIDESKLSYKDVNGWVGITDKYWLSAIVPQNVDSGKFSVNMSYNRKNMTDRYQVDILTELLEVQPNESISYSLNLYAGAKKLGYLDSYAEEQNIPLFDRAIDFGILYFLTRPIFEGLNFFYSIVGNFGIAILLLTVCIRIILFPLANKSYGSMARMRKHMPDINRLKERYKDDRQKQGTEMMKYYREHKINPVSGCLPLLIQIPVFFSLYKVLYVTLEMRHAPFYGWIQDLSAADPTNIFNLFGLLSFAPPEWLPAIGVLPILFSVTMMLQQKLNPPPADPTQKMVMAWLPWIFLIFFAAFPAGLVLYWVWNNILSILQQWIITRKIEEDKNA